MKNGVLIGLVVLIVAGIVYLGLKFLRPKKVSETKNTSYIDKLPAEKKANADIFISRMKAKGITNPFTQAAILAVISKESEFMPKPENLNYTSAQLQKIFDMPKAKADQLAGKPELIGDAVYGGKGGNAANEGFKYRGRGLNQITFKTTYQRIGDAIGKDLVGNPDLLNDISVASDAAIQFFINGILSGKTLGKLDQYNSSGINDFKDVKNALMAIYNVNAGWGSSKEKIKADVTGGLAKANARVDDFYKYVA